MPPHLIGIFIALCIGFISLTYTSLVTNNIIRVCIGAADITIGIMTLVDPEWSLGEISGLGLPYFFHEKYDG